MRLELCAIVAFVAFVLLHLFPATNATGLDLFPGNKFGSRTGNWKPSRMQLGLWQVSGYLLGFSGSPKKISGRGTGHYDDRW